MLFILYVACIPLALATLFLMRDTLHLQKAREQLEVQCSKLQTDLSSSQQQCANLQAALNKVQSQTKLRVQTPAGIQEKVKQVCSAHACNYQLKWSS
jgi:cell division protein FtsL